MRQKQAPPPRHAQPRTLPAVYDPPEPTRASYNGRPPDLPGQPAPVADMYGDMSADNGLPGDVVREALNGKLLADTAVNGRTHARETGAFGRPSTRAVQDPEQLRTAYGSPWTHLKGAWELATAVPLLCNDGGLAFQVSWFPVWAYEEAIARLGPQARQTLARLRVRHPNVPPRSRDDRDDRWTVVPEKYRFPDDDSWDAPVTKIRLVKDKVQGLVQWPASAVLWSSFTEQTRARLDKDLANVPNWVDLRERLRAEESAPRSRQPEITRTERAAMADARRGGALSHAGTASVSRVRRAVQTKGAPVSGGTTNGTLGQRTGVRRKAVLKTVHNRIPRP